MVLYGRVKKNTRKAIIHDVMLASIHSAGVASAYARARHAPSRG